MRDLRVAAGLEDVGEAHEVRFDVGQRVLEAVADPGLGGEVDHPVEARLGEGRLDRGAVGEVGAEEAVGGRPGRGGAVELGEPRLLEADVVIVVDDVEPDHGVAPREKRARDVEADEAGVAGDEDPHDTSLMGRRARSRSS